GRSPQRVCVCPRPASASKTAPSRFCLSMSSTGLDRPTASSHTRMGALVSDLVFSTASTAPIERLTEAFNRGFEGYLVPMHHTADSLSVMLRTNDVRLTDSLIAWAPDGESAGVALLAVRGDRGWVAGMGIAPAWRGNGHGAALLSALIAR